MLHSSSTAAAVTLLLAQLGAPSKARAGHDSLSFAMPSSRATLSAPANCRSHADCAFIAMVSNAAGATWSMYRAGTKPLVRVAHLGRKLSALIKHKCGDRHYRSSLCCISIYVNINLRNVYKGAHLERSVVVGQPPLPDRECTRPTLPKLMSLCFFASSSYMGAILRQGGHHTAVNHRAALGRSFVNFS
jgi:hypothetical protein